MLRGLHAVPEANASLPFVRVFYTQPSQYVWHDADGQAHTITQAEGGEQRRSLDASAFRPGTEVATPNCTGAPSTRRASLRFPG